MMKKLVMKKSTMKKLVMKKSSMKKSVMKKITLEKSTMKKVTVKKSTMKKNRRWRNPSLSWRTPWWRDSSELWGKENWSLIWRAKMMLLNLTCNCKNEDEVGSCFCIEYNQNITHLCSIMKTKMIVVRKWSFWKTIIFVRTMIIILIWFSVLESISSSYFPLNSD